MATAMTREVDARYVPQGNRSNTICRRDDRKLALSIALFQL
jgi:hypothetical protein